MVEPLARCLGGAAGDRLRGALAGWGRWPEARRLRFARGVVLRTVREVLPAVFRAAGRHGAAARLGGVPTAEEAATAAARAYVASRGLSGAARAAATAAVQAAVELTPDPRARPRPEAALERAALVARRAAGALADAGAADELLRRAVAIWVEEARP